MLRKATSIPGAYWGRYKAPTANCTTKHHVSLTILIFLATTGCNMWSWQPPSVLLINVEQWRIFINATFFWIVVPSYFAWLLYFVSIPLWRCCMEEAKQRPAPAIRIRHYWLVFVNFLTSHGADLKRRGKRHGDDAVSDQLPLSTVP